MRTFSLQELQATFDQYARIHGRDAALDALERTTGTRHVFSVTKYKITPAMIVLVGGKSIFDGMFARKGPRMRGRPHWLS